MQVQDDHELIDSIAQTIKKFRDNKNITNHGIAYKIIESIDLAFAKPEPLAKNKQTENEFQCNLCEKEFPTLSLVQDHIRNGH